MADTFRKTVFTWSRGDEIRSPTARLSFVPMATGTEPELMEAIADVVSVSVDAIDRGDLEAESPMDVAKRRLAEAREDFRFEPRWWELALDEDGGIAGLHMPVVFREGERDGRPEGTIHYIGVAPAMRGRGYGTELLARTTMVLRQAGVWRIYTDTAEINAPMKRAFRAVGYAEGPTRDVLINGRPK